MLSSGVIILFYSAGLMVVNMRKQWIIGSVPLKRFFNLMIFREAINLLRGLLFWYIGGSFGSFGISRYFGIVTGAIFVVTTFLLFAALYQLVIFGKVYTNKKLG